MTHYDNNPTKQKEYLMKCGYTRRFLNSLSRKQLYSMYRKHENDKNMPWK